MGECFNRLVLGAFLEFFACNISVAHETNMLHIRPTETASDAHEVQRVSAMVESPRR